MAKTGVEFSPENPPERGPKKRWYQFHMRAIESSGLKGGHGNFRCLEHDVYF